MSNRRRPRNRHAAAANTWPKPGPGEEYAAQPALVPSRLEDGAAEFARKASHDRLIETWGDLRRSGIWWTHHHGAQGEQAYREIHDATGAPVGPEAEEHLVGNPELLVVIAWAIVERGTPPGAGTDRDGWMSPEDQP